MKLAAVSDGRRALARRLLSCGVMLPLRCAPAVLLVGLTACVGDEGGPAPALSLEQWCSGVDMDGDTLVVRADPGIEVYRRNGSEWMLEEELTLPAGSGRFGVGALALRGDTLVVGSDEWAAELDKVVFVYRRGSEGWTQTARLAPVAPDPVGYGEVVAASAGHVGIWEGTESDWPGGASIFALDDSGTPQFLTSLAGTPRPNPSSLRQLGLGDGFVVLGYFGRAYAAQLGVEGAGALVEFGGATGVYPTGVVAVEGQSVLVGTLLDSETQLAAATFDGSSWSIDDVVEDAGGEPLDLTRLDVRGDVAVSSGIFDRGVVLVFQRGSQSWGWQQTLRLTGRNLVYPPQTNGDSLVVCSERADGEGGRRVDVYDLASAGND